MSVLALLIVLIAQVVGAMGDTWRNGLHRINNFTKARAMLNLFARDIQAGVFREDLAAFPDDKISIYTRQPGVGGSRSLTLVEYAINTSDERSPLQRGDLPVGWTSTISFGDTLNFGTNIPVARDTAAGVVGFELQFVQADGTFSTTFSPKGANPTRAVAVALAVVDDLTIRRLSEAGLTAALRAELQNSVASGSRGAKAAWEDHLQNGLDWSAYPKSLATGLKIFERHVPLPASR